MTTRTSVILAAGIGARLDIFETSKPLVKLRGKSLIVRTMESLKEAGITQFIVVIRKNDRLIKKELMDHDHILFVDQTGCEKGMLGSILSVENILFEPFFITACDLCFERNPFRLFDVTSHNDCISVLVSIDKEYNSISGAQEKIFFQNGQLFYPENKASCNGLEAGIYHFTPKAFADFCHLVHSNNIDHIGDAFRLCNNLRPVLLSNSQWFDINTPDTLIRAELLLQDACHTGSNLQPKDAIFEHLPPTVRYESIRQLEFDIVILKGIIENISKYEIIPHEYYYSPHHIIIDRNIYEQYGKPVSDQLKSMGYRIHEILVDPGEKSKSLDCYAKTAEMILTAGIEKKSIIISIGGGVVKDLAGFLASTLYRGIGFISFPTTVLSQCDAAIALKQGINGANGKNLIGSYYVPMKVIVDPTVLQTLDRRFICDGLAECLKQSFAQNKDFFYFFQNYAGDIADIDFLEEAITQAIRLKIKSIQEDIYEEGESLVNQYGHEIGHAVEYLSGYQLLHGESVAIGMRVSAELSHLMGIADQEVVDSHIELLQRYCLPFCVPDQVRPDDIINTLRYNKKFHGGSARLVLVKNIGELWHDENYYTVYCTDEFLEKAITNSYE